MSKARQIYYNAVFGAIGGLLGWLVVAWIIVWLAGRWLPGRQPVADGLPTT